jgi:hypothetical protein
MPSEAQPSLELSVGDCPTLADFQPRAKKGDTEWLGVRPFLVPFGDKGEKLGEYFVVGLTRTLLQFGEAGAGLRG